MTFDKQNFGKVVVVVVLVALAAYGGYQMGVEQSAGVDEIERTVQQSGLSLDADITLLEEALSIIKSDHIRGSEVSDKELLYGAIKGVVGALDDPYSTFFPPDDAQRFSEDISGSFGGIGAEIGMRDGQLVVISPLRGTPAEEAGLQPQDQILKVDDTFTDNLSLNDSVEIIRGKVGSEVVLLVLRDEWEEPKEIEIVRDTIQIPTLEWEMKEGSIAHIQLISFNANAPQRFYEASVEAITSGARGVVLDLRNNSGGFLSVANNIAGWFLNKGTLIVQERFPSGDVRHFRSDGSGVWNNFPVVVLVNEGSASASEIVAGALRDQLGVQLVGKSTFGKGTVQEVKDLGDGSKIKISIAEWVTPNGTEIEGSGLAPDVEVEIDSEDLEEGQDPQLERALDIVGENAKNVKRISDLILERIN